MSLAAAWQRNDLLILVAGAVCITAACSEWQPRSAERIEPPRGAHEEVDNPTEVFTDENGLNAGVPIDHPAVVHPASDDFPTGPALGARLPDFSLPNQYGETIDFQSHREGRRTVLLFHRSAVW